MISQAVNSGWLYDLLPIVLREHDADNGYPLRDLLRIIANQSAQLEADMWQLYADHFIETCQPWVIPYLGDMIGNELIWDGQRLPTTDTASELFPDLTGPVLRPVMAATSRADVANTIRYRRRKGTSSVLEVLSRDVTGWFVHVVETQTLLGTTQNLGHLRAAPGWADLRQSDLRYAVDGPFDTTPHSVRLATLPEVPCVLPTSVAAYVWRLQSYPLSNLPAREAGASWRRSFSPLRTRSPLFRQGRMSAADSGPVRQLDAPGPIRASELVDVFGSSFSVQVNGVPLEAADFEAARLDPWPVERPEGRRVGVDPTVGRLAIGEEFGSISSVDVSWHAGFSADMGGGPYARHAWLLSSALPRFAVREGSTASGTVASVSDAIDAWAAAGRPDAVITVLDSRTYVLPERLRLPRSGSLAIESADGERPLLITAAEGLSIDVDTAHRPGEDTEAMLTLGGVAVEGHLAISGALRRLRLLHCTLIPGRRIELDGTPAGTQASLTVRGGRSGPSRNRRLRVEVAFTISGPLRIPEDAEGVCLLDSIIDGRGGAALAGIEGRDRDAAPAVLERCTILGAVFARELQASEVIFTEPVSVDRTQQGCVRYSYVPAGSRTPRRFNCQPDLAEEAVFTQTRRTRPRLSSRRRRDLRDLGSGPVAPHFVSLHYGEPAFCQLALDCPTEISTGAEDGSEMGAFSFLKQPQRERNLTLRLSEYLPIGFQSEVIHVT